MTTVVGVRFKKVSKMYYFDPGNLPLKKGTEVIIDTQNGIEFGVCVSEPIQVEDEAIVPPLRRVIRIATDKDRAILASKPDKEARAMHISKIKAAEHRLEMKFTDVEYSFDDSKIVFYFTADGRVDFRELVKDLAGIFHTRIELRQIGVRDQAKVLGGMGICGRPFCCASFLDEFQPVSIKMAKEQSLSLNPSKISGTCGRLMCCLKYEQPAYEHLQKITPRVDSVVNTPHGKGTVTDVSLLRGNLKVRLENAPDTPPKVVHVSEIRLIRPGRGKGRKQSEVNEGEEL